MAETDLLLGDFYTYPEEVISKQECISSDDMYDDQCEGHNESAVSCSDSDIVF